MSDSNSVGEISLELKLKGDDLESLITKIANEAVQKLNSSFDRILNGVRQSANEMTNEFRQSFNEIKKSFDKVGNKVIPESKKMSKRISDDFKETSNEINKEFSSVNQSVNKKFSNISSKARRVSNDILSKFNFIFKKIGIAIAATFSVQMIKKFGQSCIENAASVQAANSQLEQTFGELSDSANAAMKKVADESGIVQTRLQGVGTSIYAFAKTTGMDSASALNMMQEALQVTADSAAYYDRSLEDTAESLKSFLKGNFENDAALGLSCTEMTRNTAANKLYGKSFKDLSEAQKQLTLLQMVKDANALSGAMGQAAREADGWENVTGNLKEAWNQLLAAIGKPILKGAIAVIKKLTEWITTLAQYAKAASAALAELFGWGDDGSDHTAENTTKTANSIADSVENQNNLTKAVAATNAEVKRGLASFDKLNVISQSKSDSDSGEDNGLQEYSVGDNIIGSVDIDTSGITSKIQELKNKIIAVLRNLYEYSGLADFNKKLEKAWKRIDTDYIYDNVLDIKKNIQEIAYETMPHIVDMQKAFGGLAGSIAGVGITISGKATEAVTGGVRKWLDKDKDYIIDTGNKITDNLSTGFGNLTPVFDSLSDIAAKFFDTIRPFKEGVISNALSFFTHLFGNIGKDLSEKFAVGTKGLQNIFFFMTEDLPQKIKDTVEKIKNWFSDLWEKINTSFHTVFDPWVEIFDRARNLVSEKIIEPVKTFFSGLWEKISGGASEAWEGVKEAFSPVADWFKNVFSEAWQKVKDVFSKGGEIFTGIKDGIESAFKTVVNGLIDGINFIVKKAFDGLNDALTTMHNMEILGVKPFEWVTTFDVPQIPKLANGGIVKAPTLAVVGDNAGAGSGNPEVISPLNKLQGMIDNSHGYDLVVLEKILDYLKRIYEMFVIFRSQGGNVYEFVAQLNESEIFRAVIHQNELYKKAHNGKDAF